jgi:ATP-dependent Lhr-like helicase
MKEGQTTPENDRSREGKLDPAAIAQVREEAWPDVRDADELHDLLLTLIALPEQTSEMQGGSHADSWNQFFEQLKEAGRAGRAFHNNQRYWVAAERSKSFATLLPDAQFESALKTTESATPSQDDVLLSSVQGWMAHLGPTCAGELANLLGLPASEIDKALLRMEAAGSILRGKFTDQPARTGLSVPQEEIEWCDRRLLARIHRLTVGSLRKQIQPVTAAQFMRWLLRWQHVSDGTQVLGERGTLEILRQLQGFEVAANAWECTCWRAASPTTIQPCSIIFASPARLAGDGCHRIRPRSTTALRASAGLYPPASHQSPSLCVKMRIG